MAVSIALWSMAVSADEPIEFAPPADLRITNVALGADLEDEHARTTLKLVYSGIPAEPETDEESEDEDEEEHPGEPIATVLCSLTPGKVEQAKIDLVLEANQAYVFDVVGKNTLYISGNYIEQTPSDLPPDEDEILDDEEEEAFRLEDVSSDVAVDGMDEDDKDAPELLPPSSPPKAKGKNHESNKRPREEDAEPASEQLSKKQKKKQNKQKAEGGAAAAQPTPEKQAPKKQEKQPEPKQQEQEKGGEGEQGESKKKKKKNKNKNKGDKSKL